MSPQPRHRITSSPVAASSVAIGSGVPQEAHIAYPEDAAGRPPVGSSVTRYCWTMARRASARSLASSAECTVTSRIDSSSFSTKGTAVPTGGTARTRSARGATTARLATSRFLGCASNRNFLDAYAFVLVVSTRPHFPLASMTSKQRDSENGSNTSMLVAAPGLFSPRLRRTDRPDHRCHASRR